MTETMIIRFSFGLLAEKAATAIPMFFQRLFEIAPQVRPMFPGDLAEHLSPSSWCRRCASWAPRPERP